jgi:PAS domain S-box-containing protein
MSDTGISGEDGVRQRTLDRVSDAIVAVDEDFRYTYVNQTAQEVLERDRSELLGETIWSVFPDAVDTVAEQQLREALKTTQSTQYERYSEATGRWLEVRVYPDDQGLSLFFTDITERKEYEQAQKDLHDATREMLSASTPEEVSTIVTEAADSFLGFGMNGVHLYDETVEGLVPVSISEGSRSQLDTVPTLDSGISWDAFQQGESEVYQDLREVDTVYNEETPFRSEVSIPLGEHGVFIASATEPDAFTEQDIILAETLTNNAQTALDQLQTTRELQQRERELKRNQEFLQQTASVAKLGGWEVDVETEAVNWTDEVYRIHGIPVGETPSLDEAFEAYHPEDRADIVDAWEELVESGEPYDLELRIETQGDLTRWVRTIGLPEYDSEGEEVVKTRGVFQDITKRKERENELRQYREAVESSEDLIIAVRSDGRYVFANSTYREYYDDDELAGKSITDVVGESRFERTIRPHHEQALAGESVSYERTETFPGLGERTLSVKYTPVQDDQSVIGYVGVLRDVTEKKQYENQLEAQRNNLEVLNSIVRHDIRNDLQLIQTYVEIIQSQSEDMEYLDEILKAAKSATEITESAKDITNVMLQSSDDTTPVPLRSVLQTEIQDIRASYEKAIVTLDGHIPDVEVAADEMLNSVFRNLLNNAVQHNDKEIPEVAVAARANESRVVVHIADNGPGIPDERKETIFEEEHMGLESDGTGLGLYLVRTLVDRYEGQVRVVDNDPDGAVFILSLPRATA